MTETAKVTTLDPCARRAQQAMDEIEQLETQQGKMTREAWRKYGAALLEKRQQVGFASNKIFGEWVHENGLDRGAFAHHNVRSHAMWLAERWDYIVNIDHNVTDNHPTHIRAACRKLGYAWARETKHQKERKASSVRTRRAAAKSEELKPRVWTWLDAAAQEGMLRCSAHDCVHRCSDGVNKGGGESKKLRVTISKRWPDLEFKDGPELRTALRTLFAERKPEQVDSAVTAIRETLPESARERFDKAVKKAVDLEVARQVSAKVVEATRAAHARMQEMFEDSQRSLNEYLRKTDGLKQAITKTEYKVLLGCLHPDQPDRTPTQLAKAFNIVRKLQDYIDAFDK